MSDASVPEASLVVPSRNRPALLSEILGSLAEQDFDRDRYEIVVVDDGSAPPLAVPPGVSLLRIARRNVNAARNAGAKAARSELICFLDDDVALPPQWLREMVEGANRYPGASCLGGPIRVRLEGGPTRWICHRCAGSTVGESPLDLGPDEGPTDSAVFGGNLCVRRRAFVEVGYFDEDVPQGSGEEIEWEDRVRSAGGSIVYLPDAWLWHRRTHEQMLFHRRFTRSFSRGRGDAYYAHARGERPSGAPRRLLASLAHAARRRCQAGIVRAGWELGFILGSLEFAFRRFRGTRR